MGEKEQWSPTENRGNSLHIGVTPTMYWTVSIKRYKHSFLKSANNRGEADIFQGNHFDSNLKEKIRL